MKNKKVWISFHSGNTKVAVGSLSITWINDKKQDNIEQRKKLFDQRTNLVKEANLLVFEDAAENTHFWQLSNLKDCYTLFQTFHMWYSILLKTSLLSLQTLEFKQVTLNCVRERKCFMLFCCTQWSKSFNCLLFYWIWHSLGVECCSDQNIVVEDCESEYNNK